jgi:putative tryptophan/tyrosine transport system substrate-binding protein
MRRREFMAGLGSAAAWPLAARAQQLPVIGFLHSQSLPAFVEPVAGFHRGLAETGYIEGKNVAIDYRWAEGHVDRVVALAAEMVRNRYAVIAMIGSTPGALALKAATRTVPIVFRSALIRSRRVSSRASTARAATSQGCPSSMSR